MDNKVSNRFFTLLITLTILITMIGTFVFLDSMFTPIGDNHNTREVSGKVTIDILPQNEEDIKKGVENEEI